VLVLALEELRKFAPVQALGLPYASALAEERGQPKALPVLLALQPSS